MFVKSTGFVSQTRTDCSIAWFVKPMPAAAAQEPGHRSICKAKAAPKSAAGKAMAREKQRAAAKSKVVKRRRLGIAATGCMVEYQKRSNL